MVESGDDLRKIMTQLQAVISSLESLKLEIVKKQIEENMEQQVMASLELLK